MQKRKKNWLLLNVLYCRIYLNSIDRISFSPYYFIMHRAVFAGSFDPPTFGHLNVIERGSALFDELFVVIAVNSEKKYLFSAEERFSMMKKLTEKWKNVSIYTWDKLIVDFAEKHGADIFLRGVRNFTDFSYEFDLSLVNKGLNDKIETFFLPTDPDYFVLRSSVIKELASLGGDVSKMVPDIVDEALKAKFANKKQM